MLISDKENGTKLYEDGMPIAEIMVIPDICSDPVWARWGVQGTEKDTHIDVSGFHAQNIFILVKFEKKIMKKKNDLSVEGKLGL